MKKSDNTLVVMAKMPSAGRVKTRLARDIGTAEALRFYRHQLAQTCRTLAHNRRWQLVLSLSPDHARWGRHLPVDGLIGQGRGGLGERMQGLFDHVADGPLIIIGADIPAITPIMIGKAFQHLKRHDFTFGPATDGGFWLVGQRRRPRVYEAFNQVRWSTSHALEDTLENIAGCSVAYVDELNDIDTGADIIGGAV
ncbi:MAG: TIGR04282 family arsenosugar biosynthesis glycosyltransferase [Hyphomicrobiaceae bacterium]|nr:TIGR04282 family arsenosugar biosynthesis glycosyltransferase [Hyphomicrobiaceae bacterium]